MRVGVLTPHAAAGPEVELPAIAPVDVAVARVSQRADTTAAKDLRALATPSALRPAVAALREAAIDAVTLTATSLPKQPDQVRPEQVIDFVSDQVDASTEAVFIAGTGFRAAPAIEELEHRTGQLVLEANQVLVWSILAATGTELPVEGYGQLFGSGGCVRR
ncbi:hypothetical protein FB561_5371 [Kribbella amoyensis]|uniref:Maleate isomerase n=1 Tax=Kribbella amoyensis TaxID=996641 RepID=A0A561BZ49_9ACTN|nr:hypothetical protein [Kribbella amoyensis]TWD84196.1 hypothetical protein FB561_5371 [Kribbella amoyensis]